MESVEMIAIAKRIAAAQGPGRWRNADVTPTTRTRACLSPHRTTWKSRLSNAFIVDTATIKSDEAASAHAVQVNDLVHGREETFRLVGPGDEDYDNNKSPRRRSQSAGVARQKVGEVVEVQAPIGRLRFGITGISSRADLRWNVMSPVERNSFRSRPRNGMNSVLRAWTTTNGYSCSCLIRP